MTIRGSVRHRAGEASARSPIPRSLGRAGLVCLALSATIIALPSALAVTTGSPTITRTSIAHAKFALGKLAYTRLLGSPFRYQAAGGADTGVGFQQPANYTRLVFATRKINVYFKDGVDRAIQITTWNKAYRTAAGIGPCSTVADLKKAYGSKLKRSKWSTQNGQTYVYTMGDLLFAAADLTHVTAVGLYDSRAPGANKEGGTLPFAGFVIQAPDQIPCT
jgi:hypothetical protein